MVPQIHSLAFQVLVCISRYFLFYLKQFLLFLWSFMYIILLNQEKCFTIRENMVLSSQLCNQKDGLLDGLINIENQTLFFNFKLILFRTWKNFIRKEYWLEEVKKSTKNNNRKQKRENLNLSEGTSNLS